MIAEKKPLTCVIKYKNPNKKKKVSSKKIKWTKQKSPDTDMPRLLIFNINRNWLLLNFNVKMFYVTHASNIMYFIT